MNTVLLAVDETEESIAAVRQARQLFGPEAEYLAVNVSDAAPTWAPLPMPWGAVYPYPYGSAYPEIAEVDAEVAEGETARRTAEEAAGAAGVDATPLGDVGDPPTAILDAAEAHRADVIVVGSTGKGWWKRLLEGSVARDVVRRSPIPVLIAGQHPEP